MKSKIILLVFISCALFSVGCKRHAVTAKPAVPEPSTQAATATSTTPTPVALPPGLVFYYNFDTEPVNGKISDKSGSGNDGQAVGVQWVADGHLGGSAAFGITNSYITVPNNDSLNPPRMTLAAWIKTSVRDEIWRRIFDKNFKTDFAISIGGGFVPNRDFHGKAIWEVNTISNRAASGTLGSVVPVNDGQWHQVVVTYDGSAQRLYVDGLQRQVRRWSGVMPNNSSDLTLGSNRTTPDPKFGEVGASFGGLMDDVMMFNRALSTPEVAALYDSQKTATDVQLPMPAPTPAGTPSKASAADRLKQLKDLLDQGLINQDQYDQKKKEIIDSM